MHQLTYGPRSSLLKERSSQLAQLGIIVADWSSVEQVMAFLYDYLLAQRGEPREFGHSIDGLGVAAFGVVHSVRTKLDLLHYVIEWRLGLEILAEFRSTTGEKIAAAAKARNTLAHGVVEYSNAVPDALIINWNGREIIYREQDFEEVRSKIRAAYEAVVWFHNKRARGLCQTMPVADGPLMDGV